MPALLQAAAFQKAAQPVWDWYETNFGDEWIKAAQTAVNDCEAKLTAEFEEAAK